MPRMPLARGCEQDAFPTWFASVCRGRRSSLLAEADALRSLKLDRRAALWQVRGLSDMADLPLFAHQPVAIHHVPLPVMTKGEHVITDYQTAGLSLKSHPMRFLRALFAAKAC